MKKIEDFRVEWLASVKDDFGNVLLDVITAADESETFADECGKLIWDVNNRAESINLVECVAYKFGFTEKEALLFLGGLHAGWRLNGEIELTTGNGTIVKL